MTALPEFLDNAGGALGPLSFGAVDPGTISPTITIQVWNGKGVPTADPLTEFYIGVLAKGSTDATFNADSPAVIYGYLEAQVTGVAPGGAGAPPPYVTAWAKIAPGRPLRFPTLPGDSGYVVQLRVNVPIGQLSDAFQFKLDAHYQLPSLPIPVGLWSAGQRGVFSGAGDTSASWLIAGGALTASGSPDNNVHLADLQWRFQGVPKVALAQAIAFDQHDGAGALLAAGQAYWLALTAGAGPGLTVTKGLAAAYPVPISGRPALPVGESLVGFVQVPQTAAILAGDIDQTLTQYGGWALYNPTGLHATLGFGSGIVGDSFDATASPVLILFPDNSTVSIWKVPSNPDLVWQAAKPHPQALELWRVTTAAGAITVMKDVRRWLGPERERTTLFLYGGVGAELAYGVLPGPGDRALVLPSPMMLRTMMLATATGSAKVDLAFWNGAAWISVFTSSGTQDRRPAVTPSAPAPGDGIFYSVAALPEVLVLPGYTQLRLQQIADTTPSVTTSDGLFLDVWSEAA
jgi:hypothetical protein